MKISKGIDEDASSLEYEQLSYVKFGDYKSSDRLHPDTLNITIVDKETFETEYSINTKINLDGTDMYLPIRNKNSNNSILLELWKKEVVKNPAIKIGNKVVLYTWLDKSKANRKYPLRRFVIFDASRSSSFSSGVS